MVTKTLPEKLEKKEMRYITEELRRFGYKESRKFKVKKANAWTHEKERSGIKENIMKHKKISTRKSSSCK